MSFFKLADPAHIFRLFKILYHPFTWTLRDEFRDTLAAGSVQGTPAVPGPGTREVVTDTNNKLSIGSSNLILATGGVGNGNPGIWYESIARSSGLLVSFELTLTASIVELGWDNNQTGTLRESIRPIKGSDLTIRRNGTSIIIGSAGNAGVVYKFVIVLRTSGAFYFIKGDTFTNWTLVYQHTLETLTPMYPGIIVGGTSAVSTSDYIHIPRQSFLPKPLAYDTFTRADGAIGSSEVVGPDNQIIPAKEWTGAGATIVSNKAIITPTEGAESITNGGMEGVYDDESEGGGGTVNVAPGWDKTAIETDGTDTLDESATAHSGNKSQLINVTSFNEGIATEATVFLPNNWYLVIVWLYGSSGSVEISDGGRSFFNETVTPNIGSWTKYSFITFASAPRTFAIRAASGGANFLADDVSIKPLTLSTLFSSLEASKTDVLASADITVIAVTQAGLVTNLDNAVSPANFLVAYHNGVSVILDKCVGGTYTELIKETIAYSAGAAIQIHTYISGSDLKVRVYYNNAFIGSEQTVSDAGIISNILHGLFSTYPSNTLDNFTLFARGQNDETYATLNKYSSSNI